ncbi:hypothetical protein [Streptomyces radicis]|uniref:hypothetical protein n=1 Tax=Streptomyces radicis TaxID=1750517 RepID=UPI0016015DCA
MAARHRVARRLEQHDRLGDQLDGAADDQLVGGLDELTGTGRADPDHGRGHRRQDRQRAGERSPRAARPSPTALSRRDG